MSLNYKDYFLSLMIAYITDEKPEVRQAASYGIGLMAQYGGNGYTDAINGLFIVVPRMLYMLYNHILCFYS